MIKSKIKAAKSSLPEPEFPILMQYAKNKESGFVVMFLSSCVGVVVASCAISRPVGYFSDSWVDYDDCEWWERLPVGSKVKMEVA